MGWCGSYAETPPSKVEDGLFEEKEGGFGCEVSLCDEQSPLVQVELAFLPMKERLYKSKSLVRNTKKMNGGGDPVRLEIGMVLVCGKP